MRETIRPNDVVLHRPSGEKWVIAGVNYNTGEVVPFGYPFPSVGKIADCEIVERNYETEPQSEETIKKFLDMGMVNFVDTCSAMFHGFL